MKEMAPPSHQPNSRRVRALTHTHPGEHPTFAEGPRTVEPSLHTSLRSRTTSLNLYPQVPIRSAPQPRSLLHFLCHAGQPLILPRSSKDGDPKGQSHARGACLRQVESALTHCCSVSSADLASLERCLGLLSSSHCVQHDKA
mmetsp:Transcript_16382/g.44918  ORF Transcript_16382/g.44918 Transcript_16382/m.44918 type:complete len:142 (+) Transcript_16382:770-1195(+)